MIQQAGWRAFEGMRGGMDGLWDGGGRLMGKLGVRSPAARRSRAWSLGSRPGRTALFAALAALAIAGIMMYLRKKRQVAEHYTMGDGEAAAWEGGSLRSFESAESART